ncbi:MAG: prepilin-type N-terminal cleavage/methylation domain-containing protein, partial [Acidimicrobiia bacterium]
VAMRRGQHGETLIETLVSTALLGIVGIGIIGAIASVLISTDIDRKISASETVLRSYVAAIQDAPYQDCASRADYSPSAVGYAPDSARYSPSVTDIAYWQAPAADARPVLPPATVNLDFVPGCPSPDPGLQRLDIAVTTSESHATVERVTVFKRRVS